MNNIIFGSAAEAVEAEDSSAKARAELQKTIEQKTAEFIAAGGAVVKVGVTKSIIQEPEWESKNKGTDNAVINRRIVDEYATAKSPKALAKELGISVPSLSRRAGRLGVSRILNRGK